MKLKTIALSVSLLASFSSFGVTLQKAGSTDHMTILKTDNETYNVKVCESSLGGQSNICSIDTVSVDIITKRFDTNVAKLQELFSTDEKIEALKKQMEDEITSTGHSELTIMPGATLKADSVYMLDLAFPMVVSQVRDLPSQRDSYLNQIKLTFDQISGFQGQSMTLGDAAFAERVDLLISQMMLELKPE